jgi:hypothetical protein
MSWPGSLLIRVTEGPAKPAGRRLVSLRILDTKRNPYSLGPYLTDEDGEILITREDVERQVKRAQEAAPMDYGFIGLSLERSYPVEISVKSKDELEEDVKRARDYYPDEAERLEALVRQSTNNRQSTYKEKVSVSSRSHSIEIGLS